MNKRIATHDQSLGLPHREPFLFISEIVRVDPQRSGAAIWRLTGNEDFFRGHFPGSPVVPGVLLGESLAQLAGLVAFGHHHTPETDQTSQTAQIARLARIDIKLPRAVVPPADIQLEATVTRTLDGLVMFEVCASLGGDPVAIGSLVLALSGNTAAAPTQAAAAARINFKNVAGDVI